MTSEHAADRRAGWPAIGGRIRGLAYVAVPWVALLLPGRVGLVALILLTVAAAALLWRDADVDPVVLGVVAAFTVCDLSPLSYDGSVVRLYQLSVLQVLVVVARHRSEFWRALRVLRGVPLAALALVMVLTLATPLSLLWTISVHQTLVSTVGQVSATGLLVLFAAAVAAGMLKPYSPLTALWVMATASSVAAVSQFLVTVLTPFDLAEAGGSGVPWPRPSGLMTEAVWAALVAATGAALALVVWRMHPRAAMASMVVHAAALTLVLSRAVLLGVGVGGIVALAVAGRRYLNLRRATAAGLAATLCVALLGVFAPAVLQRFDPRVVLGIQSNADGGSAASRAAVYRLVANELPHHLPLGAGAGSLNELTSDPAVRAEYIDGGELNSGRGSTNFFLGYTFDFGPAGSAVALALVLVVLALGLRLAPRDGGLSVFLALLYVVDFQFNNGFRFGFVHLLLGVAIGTAGGTSSRPGSRRPIAGSRPVAFTGVVTRSARSAGRR